MFIRTKMLSQAAGAAVAGAMAAMPALAPAQAQETAKIGLILPMTGGQASTGKQIDNAVKLYMQQQGDTVAGKKIEIILKDDGANPENTKRIAQELIVNDKVSFIAGFGVTPAALAAAPLATQAKIPEIVMAAGTSIITPVLTSSPNGTPSRRRFRRDSSTSLLTCRSSSRVVIIGKSIATFPCLPARRIARICPSKSLGCSNESRIDRQPMNGLASSRRPR